jgi:hypothetical protein
MADEFGVELIGQIPLDPIIREKEDEGMSEAFEYFSQIVDKIEKIVKD